MVVLASQYPHSPQERQEDERSHNLRALGVGDVGVGGAEHDARETENGESSHPGNEQTDGT